MSTNIQRYLSTGILRIIEKWMKWLSSWLQQLSITRWNSVTTRMFCASYPTLCSQVGVRAHVCAQVLLNYYYNSLQSKAYTKNFLSNQCKCCQFPCSNYHDYPQWICLLNVCKLLSVIECVSNVSFNLKWINSDTFFIILEGNNLSCFYQFVM